MQFQSFLISELVTTLQNALLLCFNIFIIPITQITDKEKLNPATVISIRNDSSYLLALSKTELIHELGWGAGPLIAVSRSTGAANRKELRNLHTASRGYRRVPRTAQIPPPEEWLTAYPGLPDC